MGYGIKHLFWLTRLQQICLNKIFSQAPKAICIGTYDNLQHNQQISQDLKDRKQKFKNNLLIIKLP